MANVLFHGKYIVFRKWKVLPVLDGKAAFKISLSHYKNIVCVWKLKAREVFMGATFQIKYWYQVFVEKALNNNGQIQCCYVEIGM